MKLYIWKSEDNTDDRIFYLAIARNMDDARWLIMSAYADSMGIDLKNMDGKQTFIMENLWDFLMHNIPEEHFQEAAILL